MIIRTISVDNIPFPQIGMARFVGPS